jgi:hypothetical protein
MTGGTIAGIAIGAAVVILLCAALCYFFGRANTYRDVFNHKQKTEGGLPMPGGYFSSGMSPFDATEPSPPPISSDWGYRLSNQAESGAPPSGTFIGHNRLAGTAELAQETSTIPPGDYYYPHQDANLSPPADQHQAATTVTREMQELPGGKTPPIAEVGPYN